MQHIAQDFDWDYWAGRYERDYKGVYVVFVNEDGSEGRDSSTYFDTVSRVVKRRGYLVEKEFLSICEWKTPRQMWSYRANTVHEIQEATRKALQQPSMDEDKVNALVVLQGVGVPVASAILTLMYPEEFCVLDYRAWRALIWLSTPRLEAYESFSNLLDKYRNYHTLDSYADYLRRVRQIAESQQTTPRKIEMALWKYDKEKGHVSQ